MHKTFILFLAWLSFKHKGRESSCVDKITSQGQFHGAREIDKLLASQR